MSEILYNGGLVLEGGGMRGLYTAGVLDFFIDKGIYFKNCYGVSAGASQCCSYLSKQKGRALEVNTEYMKKVKETNGFHLKSAAASLVEAAIIFVILALLKRRGGHRPPASVT